ncbi:MAG: LysE family transporter [Candidatus Binatia bacterium]
MTMIASIAGFLMGLIGSMPVAGPISLLVFHRGIIARYRDAWAIGVGGALAEGFYCALAVHGFSILHESFVPLVKGVGILLPIALALYLILVRQETSRDHLVSESSAATLGGNFCIGLSVAALNPTLLLTWSGFVAVLFSLTDLRFHGSDRIVFAAGAVLGMVAWFSIFLTLLCRFRDCFPFRVIQRLTRRTGSEACRGLNHTPQLSGARIDPILNMRSGVNNV